MSESHQELLEKYVDAFHRYDVDQLTSLLHQDATFSVPPYALWLRGRDSVKAWLLGRGAGLRGSRLLQTTANYSPAFGQYRLNPHGGHKPFALVVLEISERQIVGWNSFLDTEPLFPLFGLPQELPL